MIEQQHQKNNTVLSVHVKLDGSVYTDLYIIYVLLSFPFNILHLFIFVSFEKTLSTIDKILILNFIC